MRVFLSSSLKPKGLRAGRDVQSHRRAFEERAGDSRAVRVGDTVYVAGTAALQDGKPVAPGDAATQTRHILGIIERALSQAIDIARDEAGAAVAREDFEAAMRAMAKLRPHVDAFFDKVTVNVADGADKEKLRENRLKLLNGIREATGTVADFSRIEG